MCNSSFDFRGEQSTSVISFAKSRFYKCCQKMLISQNRDFFYFVESRYFFILQNPYFAKSSLPVGRYFLIVFLSAITQILEGEETLKKSPLPQDNYWKSPISMSLSGLCEAICWVCEVVCCPYFPVRLQSQIIDDYGIISFNSVICSPH